MATGKCNFIFDKRGADNLEKLQLKCGPESVDWQSAFGNCGAIKMRCVLLDNSVIISFLHLNHQVQYKFFLAKVFNLFRESRCQIKLNSECDNF